MLYELRDLPQEMVVMSKFRIGGIWESKHGPVRRRPKHGCAHLQRIISEHCCQDEPQVLPSCLLVMLALCQKP